MIVDLPIPYTTLNDREIIGQFRYPAGTYRRLLDLPAAGLLNLRAVKPCVFALPALPDAMDAAASGGNLDVVVVRTSPT